MPNLFPHRFRWPCCFLLAYTGISAALFLSGALFVPFHVVKAWPSTHKRQGAGLEKHSPRETERRGSRLHAGGRDLLTAAAGRREAASQGHAR